MIYDWECLACTVLGLRNTITKAVCGISALTHLVNQWLLGG